MHHVALASGLWAAVAHLRACVCLAMRAHAKTITTSMGVEGRVRGTARRVANRVLLAILHKAAAKPNQVLFVVKRGVTRDRSVHFVQRKSMRWDEQLELPGRLCRGVCRGLQALRFL